MPAYAVLGAQWGDEGKGKIIDFLARDADVVARFSGGNNAGHTVINDLGDFSLHIIPCGVFREGVMNVIGNGTVVDPDVLIEEINSLSNAGIEVEGRLIISERAHLIMPYHVLLDTLAETSRGISAIGTTGRGIGPAYSDKTSRTGIRAADIFDQETLKERLENVLGFTNDVITKVYGAKAVSLDELYEKCLVWADKLRPYVGPAGRHVNEVLDSGGNVVLEGAQGILLDLDHGTYPYVTSSSPTIGGASTGLAIQPQHISTVLGVFKAYNTRVGRGPFPTELFDEVGEKIRTLAQEFGTTTGRPRRCGWFDAVIARYSTRINNLDSIILTRLDILDGFEKIKICVGYELETNQIVDFPVSPKILEKCTPIYEELEGWKVSTAGVSRLELLPKEARSFINRIQELTKTPIKIISTGPKRNETISN